MRGGDDEGRCKNPRRFFHWARESIEGQKVNLEDLKRPVKTGPYCLAIGVTITERWHGYVHSPSKPPARRMRATSLSRAPSLSAFRPLRLRLAPQPLAQEQRGSKLIWATRPSCSCRLSSSLLSPHPSLLYYRWQRSLLTRYDLLLLIATVRRVLIVITAFTKTGDGKI